MSQLTSPQRTELRKPAHSSRMRLAVLVPDDTLTGQVDGAQVRGETVIPYKNDSGESGVEAGMIAWFGSSSGARDIGIQRVKSIDTGTNELTIEENDLTLANNYYITVKKMWLPRPKLPNINTSGADVVFTKDGEVYTDEGEDIPPVVFIGPPDAKEIVGASATVKFTDDQSWSPVGATLSTKTWDFDGGSNTGGTGTVGDPYVVTYSTAGWYWPKLTITDSNAATSVCHVPIFIYDDANPPYTDFDTQPRNLSLQGGRQGYTVYGTADQSEFLDGTWVIRFNTDQFGGADYEMDTRFPFRGNTKFAGWLVGDSVETDTNVFSTSFEAEDITRVLNRLPGFGDLVEDTASPTEWTQIKDLDVIKAVLHVLRWSTTVLDIVGIDYDLARSAAEILIASQRWGEGSILQQCNQALSTKGIFANLVGDTQSQLHIRQDPLLMDPADRDATVTTVVDLAKTDFNLIRIDQRQRTLVKHIRLSGLAYNGTAETGYLSYAPGVPAAAVPSEDVSGQVLVDQTDTSRLAGDVYAKRNNQIGPTTIELPGNWDVFDPALQERVTFPLAADENNHGLEFTSADDWIVRGVTVNEDAAGGFVGSVTLTLERETIGTPGTGGTVLPQPVPPAPDNPTDEPSPPRAAPARYGGAIIVTADNPAQVAYTDDTSSPDWVELDTSSVTIIDPQWAMLQQQSDGKQWVYVAGQLQIYRHRVPRPGDNWDSTWGWESLVTLNQMVLAAGEITSPGDGVIESIAISIENDGWQWASWWRASTAVPATTARFGVAHTRDNWQSIHSSVTVDTGVSRNISFIAQSQVTVDQNSSGLTVYVAQSYHSGGSDYSGQLWRSLNAGGSWSHIDGTYAILGGDRKASYVYVPYSNSQYIYWSNGDKIYRSTNGGSSFAQVGAFSGDARALGGPPDDETVITAMSSTVVSDWSDGGGAATVATASAGFDRMTYFLPLTRSSGLLTDVLWVGDDPGASPEYKIQLLSVDESTGYSSISTEGVAFIAVPEIGELFGI